MDRVVRELQRGLSLHRLGKLTDARLIYLSILNVQPGHADALHLLGVIELQRGSHQGAVDLIERAKSIDPECAIYCSNLGNVLQALGRFEAGFVSFTKAICLQPEYAEAYFGRGYALTELKQHDAAIVSYDEAIRINEKYAEAFYNRGGALFALKQYEAAVASYDETLRIRPDYEQALFNRGNALMALRRYDDAIDSYDKAIRIEPDHSAYSNRGNALLQLRRYEAAIASYDKALRLSKSNATIYFDKGCALLELKQYELAIASFDHAIRINPTHDWACGIRLHCKMFICDWHDFDLELEELMGRIQAGEKASIMFPLLALTDSLEFQRQAAATYVQHKCPPNRAFGDIAKRARSEKIRVGYYSADFHNHATSYLIAELLERHDKNHFEVIGFSFGPSNSDEMRRRVSSAVDQFLDVRTLSDQAIVKLSRDLGIDIAIDLKGFTQGQRPMIFSMRAAPIQVSYLGYPGTMAADYIDYLIADPTLISNDALKHYSEKIAYLPHSYQANDTRKQVADVEFTRDELGLPAAGFVFCCFNNTFKITPVVFDSWMRILKAVDSSALWLLDENASAMNNLRYEAERQGVSKDRLVFAARMPLPQHLARHRVADLFLDTQPYNAHTTASDALWAGLPIVTCIGESFASRVAASVLTAIDLPELITMTREGYESLAIELATVPERLRAIKEKLDRNRLTTPLFDTTRFVCNLENAFVQMYERYQADLPPDHIHVFEGVLSKHVRPQGNRMKVR